MPDGGQKEEGGGSSSRSRDWSSLSSRHLAFELVVVPTRNRWYTVTCFCGELHCVPGSSYEEAMVCDDGRQEKEQLHVLLFYYYGESPMPIVDLKEWMYDICSQMWLSGRVLLAEEGINGTVSGTKDKTDAFVKTLCAKTGWNSIDWKGSWSAVAPFPDLVVKLVKELVPGGLEVSVSKGGEHLSPIEFHTKLSQGSGENTVLLDVRNKFEYSIGHFEGAVAVPMKNFGAFKTELAQLLPTLTGKEVLMYCTGGIRCEKASAYLALCGVPSAQLSGGIHRYLEAFPDQGLFKGRNFVFDRRVSLANHGSTSCVGHCTECGCSYDKLDGAVVCSVCRELVLVCAECISQADKNGTEYYCDMHEGLRGIYLHQLDHCNEFALKRQLVGLQSYLEAHLSQLSRNKRRTIRVQIERVRAELTNRLGGHSEVTFKRQCRTCGSKTCSGRCWGFWKEAQASPGAALLPAAPAPDVGSTVRRGPDWRWGNQDRGEFGKVLKVKSWCAGGGTAVEVVWADRSINTYRWGVEDNSGNRLYDVEVVPM